MIMIPTVWRWTACLTLSLVSPTFGHLNFPSLQAPNSFQGVADYLFQKGLVSAIGHTSLRNEDWKADNTVFLTKLIRENCNEGNRYSDDQYLGQLFLSLGMAAVDDISDGETVFGMCQSVLTRFLTSDTSGEESVSTALASAKVSHPPPPPPDFHPLEWKGECCFLT